ncbi:MAG: caspase family protein [Cellvibrionaceae bacterium]
MFGVKSVFGFLSLLSFGLINNANALEIPEFSLPVGAAVTAVDNSSRDFGLLDEKGKAHFRREEGTWIRTLIHPDSREKKEFEPDSRALFILVNFSGVGPRSSISFQKSNFSGLKAKYRRKGDGWEIEGLEQPLSESERSVVERYANGNSFFKTIIHSASSRNYVQGRDYPLNTTEAESFDGAGTISLAKVQKMWGKDIAEFRVSLTQYAGYDIDDGCDHVFWVTVDEGRPVYLSTSCKLKAKLNQIEADVYIQRTRGFSYSDLSISDFSPTPLPALHPRGEIVDMAFSEKTKQLVFVSKEGGSDDHWLSFWDLDRRRLVYSVKARGGMLAKSADEDVLINVGEYRLGSAHTLIGDGYQEFGNMASLDMDRKILSMGTLGRYPVTLNEKNEIEVFNLGWGKQIYRHELEHSAYEMLAAANDGRVATLNSAGNLAIHELQISHEDCEDGAAVEGSGFEGSWCEGAKVHAQLNKHQASIDLGFIISDDDKETSMLIGRKWGISLLSVHEKLPLLGYCVKAKYQCGLINYQDSTHVKLSGSSLAFSDAANEVVTNQGVYDLHGRFIRSSSTTSFGAGKIALSEQGGLTFTEDFDYGKGVGRRKIVARDLDTGEPVEEISAKTFPVKQLLPQGDSGLLVLTGPQFSDLNDMLAIDFKTLSVDKQSIEFPVRHVEENSRYILIVGADASILMDKQDQANPQLIKAKVSHHKLTKNALIYTDSNSVYRLGFREQSSVLLHRFESTIYDMIVLDSDGEKMVLQLEEGQFFLPHINKTLLLNYASAPTKALVNFGDDRGFLVAGLLDDTGHFNSAIPLMHHYDNEGQFLKVFEPSWGRAVSHYVTENGQLWSGTKDGNITVRDLDTGLILEDFSPHQGRIADIVELDGGIVATGSLDGTIKLWRTDVPSPRFLHAKQGQAQVLVKPEINKRNPKLIATFIADSDGEFIASSSDGYYWGTPKGLHRASFVDGNKIFDYTRYDYWLNRPDIIASRIGKSSAEDLLAWEKLVGVRRSRHGDGALSQRSMSHPTPVFSLSGPEKVQANETVKLNWSVSQKSRADRLHVLVNEVPVFGVEGKRITESSGDFELSLSRGANKVKAFVSNKDGVRSTTQFKTYNGMGKAQKPDLYVLAIGVSDYERDFLDLNYARKDVEDLSRLLAASEQYQKVHIKNLVDGDVTRDSVLQAKQFLAATRPDDRVVVFFAGHGFLDDSNDYYFGTVDIDPYDPAKNGLDYASISNLVDNIPSRYKLLMLDTCHSGEVNELSVTGTYAEGVVSRGLSLRAPTRAKPNLRLSYQMLQNTFVDLRASTGAVVISASGGREYALEKSGNGVFTSALLAGLGKKAADSDQDGIVSVEELRRYTYSEVSRLTNGGQTPTTRKNNLEINFGLY